MRARYDLRFQMHGHDIRVACSQALLRPPTSFFLRALDKVTLTTSLIKGQFNA